MSSEPKPSTALAVLAALTPLAGFPLLFLSLAVLSGGGTGDVEEEATAWRGLAQAWVAGGWAMYAVVALGGATAVVSGVLLFFGGSKASPAPLAIFPLALGVGAVGVSGAHDGLTDSLLAVTQANPTERAIIMAAETGMASVCVVFGFLAVGSVLVTSSLGFFLAALSHLKAAPTQRRLMGFAGLGALLTGGWCFLAADRASQLVSAYRLVAFAAPADRLSILGALLGETNQLASAGLAVAVLAGAAFAGGAAVLRGTPVSAGLLLGLGLAGLGGAAGLDALGRASRARGDQALAVPTRPPLMELEGPSADGASITTLTGGQFEEGSAEAALRRISELLPRVREMHAAAGDDAELEAIGIDLGPAAGGPALHDFLRLAAKSGVARVRLVGQHDGVPPGYQVQGDLAPLINAFRLRYAEGVVELGLESAVCKPRCEFATLSEKGLTVEGQLWATSSERTYLSDAERRRIAVRADPALSPAQLARGAVTASAHEAILVLVF